MSRSLEENPWSSSGPVTVTLPRQVPASAKVSIGISNSRILSNPPWVDPPNFTDRITVKDEKISILLYRGEIVHARWVEPGGDKEKDLPPDPTDNIYYNRLNIFKPSPFSRIISIEVLSDGSVEDVTTPIKFRHWLDTYYEPNDGRPTRMMVDILLYGPILLIFVCGLLLKLGWAEQLLPWTLLALCIVSITRFLFFHHKEDRFATLKKFIRKDL